MKKILTTLLIGCITIQVGLSDPSKKYERLIAKADKFYENFIYPKAVELYEKAIDELDEFDAESNLKIADSYRLMNQPASAIRWYEKIEGHAIMTDQDKMNFAQMLLKNGDDDRAKEVITTLSNPEAGAIRRLSALDNLQTFFADSAAYFIENMNINSEQADFSPTFFQDGVVFVSNRKSGKLNQSTYYWDETYFLDLYYSPLRDGENLKPELMSKRLNTIFHEGPAVFFDNDQKVIFTRNNFNLGAERTSVEGINMLQLFYAEKNKKGKWSKPIPMAFNSDEYSVGHPSLTNDGQTLYFSSDMPGTLGKADLFRSKFENGTWSTPENLGGVINTVEDELFPYISEENILYFASEGHPGIGGLDIYYVDLNSADPEVVNMGYPVNTKSDDFGMILVGNEGYISSNREGGVGSDDIYKVNVFRYDLTASLVDAETGALIKGSLLVVDQRTGEKLGEIVNGPMTTFQVVRGRELQVIGNSEGYLDGNLTFSTLDIPIGSSAYTLELALKKPNLKGSILIVSNQGKKDQLYSLRESIEPFTGPLSALKEDFAENNVDLVEVLNIRSILYDFDEADIRDDAKLELDKLVQALRMHPFSVTLAAHTDSRGSSSYNERLSRRRVEAARQYLLDAGIRDELITLTYYGESQVLAKCVTDDCESVHQRNRRTEIVLKPRETSVTDQIAGLEDE